MRTEGANRSATPSPTPPGKVRDNANGDVADDPYHRYMDDVGLIKALGAGSYRGERGGVSGSAAGRPWPPCGSTRAGRQATLPAAPRRI